MSDSAGEPIIEIRDPTLNGEAIVQRVKQGVARRQAQGMYGPDVANLGPESLLPGRYDGATEPSEASFPGLYEALAELIAKGHLYEPGFSSNAPVVGSLIVAVRRTGAPIPQAQEHS